ncbi:MAG: type II secretion system minor pseudopilin GspJ [Parasphingopyxis sp.]|nr:type II secretion system minor pseudopilin GspJ [Sphingomonadales bacterium]
MNRHFQPPFVLSLSKGEGTPFADDRVYALQLRSGRTEGRPHSSAGFTLVEMLVALFIFALIAVASAALLRSSTDSEEASREALESLSALRRMNIIVDRDVGQAIGRVHRDRAGIRQSAFEGGAGGGDALFSLVRRGWVNHDDTARSSLQKVEYRLENGRLERSSFPYVDGAAASAPTLVIDGVRTASVRYLHDAEWRDRWDPSLPSLMPAAIEITIDQADLGTVRQLFLVGNGA